MNAIPTTPATRMNRPPTTEPAIKPGETVLQLLFAQLVAVEVDKLIAVGVDKLVEVDIFVSVRGLGEKKVMDTE